MARLRDLTRDAPGRGGTRPATRPRSALSRAWHAPDPVALAHPVTDLPILLGRRPRGRPAAWRSPRPTTAIRRNARSRPWGSTGSFDTVICADDWRRGRSPRRTWCSRLCRTTRRRAGRHGRRRRLGGRPARWAGRPGLARCYGVLTGVGTRADLEPLADEVLASVADLTAEAG